MIHKVQEKQSLFDVAIQKYGTLDNARDLVRLNSIAFDVSLNTGTSLSVNEALGVKKYKDEIKEFGLLMNNAGDVFDEGTGIGYMIIESTFIVG